MRTDADLNTLKDKILSLPQEARFRMAAELITRGKPKHAEMVAQTVMDELARVRLFPKREARAAAQKP